jgi:hypothetical protein
VAITRTFNVSDDDGASTSEFSFFRGVFLDVAQNLHAQADGREQVGVESHGTCKVVLTGKVVRSFRTAVQIGFRILLLGVLVQR